MKVADGSTAELVVTDKDGNETRQLIHKFSGSDGIIQGLQQETQVSPASQEAALELCGLDTKQDFWFATKDTISKKYDHTFKDIFQEVLR